MKSYMELNGALYIFFFQKKRIDMSVFRYVCLVKSSNVQKFLFLIEQVNDTNCWGVSSQMEWKSIKLLNNIM